MNQLLKIQTRPGALDGMAIVQVLSEGLLIDRVCDWTQVYAMSVVGPEEAIRSLASGCASISKDGRRGCIMDVLGGGIVVRGASWAGDWDCRTIRLKDGPVHMVAWSNSMRPLGQKERKYPVVYPASGSVADRDAAIYAALLKDYTTPLIPTGVVGQPEREGEIGRRWQKFICNAIVACPDFWMPLKPHPSMGQMGLTNHWTGAGVLKIEQADLDELVSRLVTQGQLEIPSEVEREAAAIAS